MPSTKSTKTSTIYLKDNQRIDLLPGYMFPAGSIIEKKYTGIGATQSEIKASRHSIIVFPSKSIAYNKSLSNSGTFYVGSLPGNKKVTAAEIREYYGNARIKWKKLLVVANSLPKVFEALGESTFYEKFFLMFDEIDKFQGESTFRMELENCLDYYDPKLYKGCLVSATVGSFSNRILDSLQRIHVEVANPPNHTVTLYRIDRLEDVIKFLYFKIQQRPQEKYLIAHKSIKTILRIIGGLDLMTRRDVKVLCGEGSSEEVGCYYGTLVSDNLPGRINFMTAAYFSGVDIQEDFHLVALSDTSTPFSLLTISEIRQIVGRCRAKLLSIDLVIPKKQQQIKLLKRTDLIEIAKNALSLAAPYPNYLRKLQLDEDSVLKNSKAQAQLTYNSVLLLREDRHKKVRISTFTIDQYWNNHKELRALYSHRRSLQKSLGQYYSVSAGRDDFSGLDLTEEYRISFLNAITLDPSITEDYAIHKEEQKIFARFKLSQLLMQRSDVSWIIDDSFWSKISFKKEYIRRHVGDLPVYSSLRESMLGSLRTGEFYTDAQIKQKVAVALKHYNHDIVKITASDYIPVISGFFDIVKTSSQGKNGFKIIAMKQTHSRVKLLQVTADNLDNYKRYWNNC